MTTLYTDIEQFLLWFSEQEDIPLEMRRDFFGHIEKEGGIDETGRKFLDDSLHYLSHQDKKRVQVLEEKLNLMKSATTIQKNLELSLTEKMVQGIARWMNSKVEVFKSSYRAAELEILKTEESTEKIQDASALEAMKFVLN